MTIIGILGKAGAGKNLTAKLIAELEPSTVEIALADPIKAVGAKLFNFSSEQAYGSLKETPDDRYPRLCDVCKGDEYLKTADNGCNRCNGLGILYLTPRWAYQYIGSEIARALYPDVWIDYALNKAAALECGEIYKVGSDQFKRRSWLGRLFKKTPKIITITDVRFLNEARQIRDRGGWIWRIVRSNNKSVLDATSKVHISEMEMASPEMEQHINVTIQNNGTVAQLRGQVEQALLRNWLI